MKTNKQTKTDIIFEQVKPELIKMLASAPSFGISTFICHFMDGSIKRMVVKREESLIPEANNES